MILRPARPKGPILIYALSGLGKSSLAEAHPDLVLDADVFLYQAVERAFPSLAPRERLLAWRKLCGSQPWQSKGSDLALWARTRRDIVDLLSQAMVDEKHRLVVTSLRHPPWHVSAYYGVERGRYLEHLQLAGRISDNAQSEGMNARLEGYAPLVRVAAGSFLGEREEVRAVFMP